MYLFSLLYNRYMNSNVICTNMDRYPWRYHRIHIHYTYTHRIDICTAVLRLYPAFWENIYQHPLYWSLELYPCTQRAIYVIRLPECPRAKTTYSEYVNVKLRYSTRICQLQLNASYCPFILKWRGTNGITYLQALLIPTVLLSVLLYCSTPVPDGYVVV